MLYFVLLRVQLTTVPAEAVNPVALGKTRAKQFALLKSLRRTSSRETESYASGYTETRFSGYGVVMESLGLSMFDVARLGADLTESVFFVGNLSHHAAGGSVHVAVK